MTAKTKTPTIDQVVAQTIDTVNAAAVAQGLIPEQQAADAWSPDFSAIAHIPHLDTLSDEAFMAFEAEHGRYHFNLAMLRDLGERMDDAQRTTVRDIVERYEVHGATLVENAYRASIAAAIAGGVTLISAASIAAEGFVLGLTGSTLLGSIAGIGLIFATAFAVFKFGDQLLAMLRWIADRVASAVSTVYSWISEGWDMLMRIVNNASDKFAAANAAAK